MNSTEQTMIPKVPKNNNLLDDLDEKIELGDLDPEAGFYTRGVLNILNLIMKAKKFQRPRGKYMRTFTEEETRILADYIFFKPSHIELSEYKRLPRRTELPLRRKAFLHFLLGEAKFNRAKAARMAGYSPRSAKQIAYHIYHHGLF